MVKLIRYPEVMLQKERNSNSKKDLFRIVLQHRVVRCWIQAVLMHFVAHVLYPKCQNYISVAFARTQSLMTLIFGSFPWPWKKIFFPSEVTPLRGKHCNKLNQNLCSKFYVFVCELY